MIGGLSPLPGAVEFLDELRRRTQVLILSDTFEQFAAPLMRQLGMPTMLCHRLVVDDDRIVDYRLRMPDQKRARGARRCSRSNYRVVAAGDSYNDAAMLAGRRRRLLVPRPAGDRRRVPQLPGLDDYDDLLELITAALAE